MIVVRKYVEGTTVDERDLDSDFIDRLYAVAMEPERFHELAEIWAKRLSLINEKGPHHPINHIRNLESHILRAESLLHLTTTQEHLFPAPLSERLQGEPHAMLAIDSAGIIQGSNDATEKVFGHVEGQSYDKLPFQADILQHLMKESRLIARNPRYEVPPLLIRSWRVDNDYPILVSLGSYHTSGGRGLLLVKTANFTWPEKLTPIIQNAFELTTAEVNVVKRLSEGVGVSALAIERDASVETVRSQIKSIYAKMSVKNQSEFMRMTLGLATMSLPESESVGAVFDIPNVDEIPYPRPENRGLLSLPDGRVLDYAVFGAKGGRPCLLSHSEFFGDGCTARMINYAKEKNLKIIAPARPHSGQTSPYPEGVETCNQVNKDIEALLTHLEIQKVVMLGRLMGEHLLLYHTHSTIRNALRL